MGVQRDVGGKSKSHLIPLAPAERVTLWIDNPQFPWLAKAFYYSAYSRIASRCITLPATTNRWNTLCMYFLVRPMP